ncbi:MAG: hypothetical protein K2I88_01095 [Anaeroplasmataceae bacterium]|nr:hypothetical protein [Anaeroplasmataceae bacterium]
MNSCDTSLWVHFLTSAPNLTDELGGVAMVNFLKYILSKIFKKNNCKFYVTVTKLVIKKTVYIKEKDSTSKPSEQE